MANTSSSFGKNKEYIVTDHGCQTLLCLTCPFHFLPLCPGVMGTKTIVLEPEEAYLEVKGGLCNVNTRRPYGELGSVDEVHCLCCTGMTSNLTKGGPLFPGCGGQDAKVSELVAELKTRMKERGDTGQINRTEDALEQIKVLREEMSDMKGDMKLLLEHFNIQAPKENSMLLDR